MPRTGGRAHPHPDGWRGQSPAQRMQGVLVANNQTVRTSARTLSNSSPEVIILKSLFQYVVRRSLTTPCTAECYAGQQYNKHESCRTLSLTRKTRALEPTIEHISEDSSSFCTILGTADHCEARPAINKPRSDRPESFRSAQRPSLVTLIGATSAPAPSRLGRAGGESRTRAVFGPAGHCETRPAIDDPRYDQTKSSG